MSLNGSKKSNLVSFYSPMPGEGRREEGGRRKEEEGDIKGEERKEEKKKRKKRGNEHSQVA